MKSVTCIAFVLLVLAGCAQTSPQEEAAQKKVDEAKVNLQTAETDIQQSAQNLQTLQKDLEEKETQYRFKQESYLDAARQLNAATADKDYNDAVLRDSPSDSESIEQLKRMAQHPGYLENLREAESSADSEVKFRDHLLDYAKKNLDQAKIALDQEERHLTELKSSLPILQKRVSDSEAAYQKFKEKGH